MSTPRSVAAGHGDAAASFGKVLVSCNGAVVLYSPADLTLQLFTVNGKMRCAADATERVNAWALTPDGDFLLTGSERMVLKLRCLHSLRVLHTFARVEAPVCSLAIAPNENVCLVSGAVGVTVVPCPGLTGRLLTPAGWARERQHCGRGPPKRRAGARILPAADRRVTRGVRVADMPATGRWERARGQGRSLEHTLRGVFV